MIDEVNQKLNLNEKTKIRNFRDLWTNATDIYSSILFNQMTPSVQMSHFFVNHIDNVAYLGLFNTCRFHTFHIKIDGRDEYGLRIANHHFFTFVYL